MSETVLSPLIARLKRSEGWRPKAYLDSKGFLTIGWGFNLGRPILVNGKIGFQAVGEIGQDVGDMLLFAKVAEAMAAVERTRLDLDPVRREVLTELVYNIGQSVLGYPDFMRQLRQKQYAAAAENMRGWAGWYPVVHAARAEPLCRMIETGVRE
jgi:GH24 family phage-related lysozyme (muramidase)